MLAQPKYGAWNSFRDSPEAAYVALTLPRYIIRLPWHPVTNPAGEMAFIEDAGNDDKKFCWGNAAVLFARNMIKSFETSGWCQYMRGPKGGGLITGLPVDSFHSRRGRANRPVEVAIPDYRELEFASGGFVPLVYRKGTGDATFFSSQSVKQPKRFKDKKDCENSQLVSNLCYTFSVTRIAHYLKCILRDNIGSTADGPYVYKQHRALDLAAT